MSTIAYTYLQTTTDDGRMVFPRIPTEGVFLVNVYEGTIELDEHGVAALPERIWCEHNHPERPKGPVIRSMVVGDVLVIHDGPSESGLDSNSMVVVAASVGFVRAEGELAERAIRIAKRGETAHGFVEGPEYYSVFPKPETQELRVPAGGELAYLED